MRSLADSILGIYQRFCERVLYGYYMQGICAICGMACIRVLVNVAGSLGTEENWCVYI